MIAGASLSRTLKQIMQSADQLGSFAKNGSHLWSQRKDIVVGREA
jgi:hypothetical protein